MMRRIMLGAIAGAMLIGSGGCVALSAKNNRFGSDGEVVAVDGHVYLIDTRSGAAREIDLSAATPFVPPADEGD